MLSVESLADVVAVNESAVITRVPGLPEPDVVAFLTRVDDDALRLLRKFRRPEWPVHRYFPRSLDRVGELEAAETRVADDDLSPLASMPHLRRLAIASRRSYRPSVAELEAMGVGSWK